MKKLKSIITISLVLSILCLPITTYAQESPSDISTVIETTIEHLENGDSITYTLEEEAIYTRANSAKKCSRTANYRNADGDNIWSFKITATFTYNGTSSRCTSVTHSFHTNDDHWKADSMSSSYSGNKATGKITAKYYLLGICSKTIEKNITLKCDAKGNLS